MALSTEIIELIRNEIGNDQDVINDTPGDPNDDGPLGNLEAIYLSDTQGAQNPLRTALIVWRRRLANLYNKSFDVSSQGVLVNRNQKVRFAERRIKELELLIETTLRASNSTIQPFVEAVEAELA